MYIILFVIIGVSIWLFYLSWSISIGFYLKSICHNRAAKELISLTFDDGVDPVFTPKLLDVLDRYEAKATFFIIGDKALLHPNLLLMIGDRGHTIGNHSMHHRGSFPMQSTKAICNEIMACNCALENISGKKINYFRPPFGVTNPMIGRAVRQSSLRSIGWSIRSFDTLGYSVEMVAKRVAKQIKGGDIVLLHDNRENVVELTERILRYINENGYKAVSIDELLYK